MAKPKKSPWFPGSQKPWEDGNYERRDTPVTKPFVASFIDGQWRIGHQPVRGPTPDFPTSIFTSSYQSLEWRGLAEKPA